MFHAVEGPRHGVESGRLDGSVVDDASAERPGVNPVERLPNVPEHRQVRLGARVLGCRLFVGNAHITAVSRDVNELIAAMLHLAFDPGDQVLFKSLQPQSVVLMLHVASLSMSRHTPYSPGLYRLHVDLACAKANRCRLYDMWMRIAAAGVLFLTTPLVIAAQTSYDYRVLATSKTSTLEKELNEAAEAGFRFSFVMGGETAVGGNEGVAVLTKTDQVGRYAYRLLATSKTSTMQKELQEAADAGFEYRGQTIFKSAFGGQEVVCILERDNDATAHRYDYKLLATLKTSTLEKELREAGAAGYEVLGVTVSKTAIGGKELVAITRKAK
jgi:hypothetical protein